MNRLFLICATGLLAFMFPLAGIAQSYDRLWKEVEETRKKDLPQTLISQVNQIYEKARKEKNAPQMLKAYLSRVECQVGLTPDSLQRELCRLNAWAAEENDPLQKAVLAFLCSDIGMPQDFFASGNGLSLQVYFKQLKNIRSRRQVNIRKNSFLVFFKHFSQSQPIIALFGKIMLGDV